MILVTDNYTVLKSNIGGADITIKPNVKFRPFEGDYTVMSFARVRDAETGEVVAELEAGQKITSVGTVEKPKRAKKTLIED